jgi:hypothetical protein
MLPALSSASSGDNIVDAEWKRSTQASQMLQQTETEETNTNSGYVYRVGNYPMPPALHKMRNIVHLLL